MTRGRYARRLRWVLGAVLMTFVFCAAAFADGNVVSISLAPAAEDPVTIMFNRFFPFTLTDADGDSCTVVFEYSVDGTNWEPGRPPSYEPSYQASPAGSTYNWSLSVQNYEGTPIWNEDVHVWLRGTATDDDGSTTDQIGPFFLQNEPRGWFTDMAVPEYLELGGPLDVGFVLHLRNTLGAGGYIDTQQSCEFDFYINGRLVGMGWKYIWHTENDAFPLGSTGLHAYDPDYPLEVPDDLEYADEYVLEIRGYGLELDFGSISGAVQIYDPDYPEIVHTPVAGPRSAGEDIEITAQITDNQIVKGAALKYREPGGEWQDAALTNTGGDTYAGVIPGSAVHPPAVEYAIFAEDGTHVIDSPPLSLFGYDDTPQPPYSISVEDNRAPLVSGVGALPTAIKAGVDDSLTVSATGDDSTRGNSNISAAEYFVGPDPGAGNGNAMQAADGAFDSPVEALTAAIDTSLWTAGSVRRINVRAIDAAGNWTSPVAHVDVPVTDGTAPGSVTDLVIGQAPSLTKAHGEPWLTLGSATSDDGTKTIDLGAIKQLGAVSLVCSDVRFFPREFRMLVSADGSDWEEVAGERDFRVSLGEHIWLIEPGSYRYVKIEAAPIRARFDGLYYIDIAEAAVYETAGGNCIEATWTATADDGFDAGSGPAATYDLRFGGDAIDDSNFDACPCATGLPVPGIKGHQERVTFSIGALSGQVYAGLKVGDEAGNLSGLSNAATTEVQASGLTPTLPEDDCPAGPGVAPDFVYARGDDIARACIVFCDRGDFPARPIRNDDGTVSRPVRFALKAGASQWSPSAAQWKKVKGMAVAGTIYWRLEGWGPAYAGVYGPTRALLFETGEITGLAVAPSHEYGGEEAVWPTGDVAPEFAWVNDTSEMEYFHVDISINPAFPLKDRRQSIVLGGKGISAAAGAMSCQTTAAEWKRIRRLASEGGGVIHWRVRAKDSEKALTSASAAKVLIVDGGEWDTEPVDLGSADPVVRWTHTGEGIVGYRLQFSVASDFAGGPRKTVTFPSRSIAGTEYTLGSREVKALSRLASRNGASTLHWRVRGEDAHKAFVTYSPSESTPAP